MPEKRRTRPCPSPLAKRRGGMPFSESYGRFPSLPPSRERAAGRPQTVGNSAGRNWRAATAAAGDGHRGLSPKRLLGRKAHRDLFLSDGAGVRSSGIKKPISSSAVSPCRDKPNTPAFIRAFALRFFSLRAPYRCSAAKRRPVFPNPFPMAQPARPSLSGNALSFPLPYPLRKKRRRPIPTKAPPKQRTPHQQKPRLRRNA